MKQLTSGGGGPLPLPDTTLGRRTVGIASLAVLATLLDTTVLFVAFGDIARSFPSVSPAGLSWVLNGYTITIAALLVPAGKLADRIGHKRTFLTGSAIFTLASLTCALAPTAGWLIVFRLIQAVGAAALIPSSFALILRAVPRERIPVAVAIWGAAGAVAGALGPTLGAWLIDAGGWPWVFYLNLPVGLVTVVAGSRWLRESDDPSTRLPAPVGVVLAMGSAALLSLGVVQSSRWGWFGSLTLAALAGGVLVGVLFVAHQRRTAAPALDLDLFRIPNFAWANASTLAFGIAFSAMFFGSILFLTEVWGWSTLAAGFGVSPGPALVALTAPRFGRLSASIGQRPLLIAGGLSFAVGGLWRLLALDGQSAYVTDYLPSMLFTGLGVALILPQLSSTVGQALPPNRFAVGGGANQSIRQFGGTLGVALTIAATGQATSMSDALAGFDRVWWLLVAGGVLTSVLSLRLRTTVPPTPAATGVVAP